MGMFSVASPRLVELDIETRIDFVADNLCECENVDVVGAADIHDLSIGTVVSEKLSVDPDDVVFVREVTCL